MKKLLTNLSLAAAAILLLGSCAKINERIDDLEGRINGLEKENIASISTQIESINSSIADLGTIRTNIQNLTSTTAAQAQDIKDLNNEDTEIGKKISDLKKADESINTRIDNLQKYVNDTLKAYATTEWVNATFSTLAQYEATCDTIAKIDARIGSMDTRLSKSIEDCADSLKSWVNVQLDGYYTIAQMDAKVAEMNAQIDTLSSTSAATADSLKTEIAATKAEIDTVKANIRAEYKSAIETAITELDGKLSNELQTKISQVNSSISALSGRVTTLESSVAALASRITVLEAMIQSVVIVPAYSDGSVKVDNDSLYIDCIVSPDTVVKNIKKDDIAILINKVKTKAFAGVDTLKIVTGDLFEKDETNGSISIRVKISDKLPTSPDSTITIAVNVKNGKSNYTTKFAPVYVAPAPVVPEGFADLGVKDANGKPLYWAEKNLGASKPEEYGKYYSWGDVTGQTPSGSTFSTAFSWDNDVFGKSFTKVAQTTACPNGILAPAYDAATAANSSWRTPTSDEFKALAAGCVWIWTSDYNSKGKAGYIVYKAKNDADKGKANINGTWKKWGGSTYSDDSATTESYSISDTHIFFPAASYGEFTIFNIPGSNGCYWSSSLYPGSTGSTDYAYYLYFGSEDVDSQSYNNHCCGFSVRPVTTENVSPTSALPAGALSGEFSVSATKKVHFSQGNLVATIDASGVPSAWKFAANQYDYIGNAIANNSIGSTAGDIDFFGWSTSNTTYGISTSTADSDYSGDFVDWGKAYCEKNNITPDNTWRTLTTAEWQYLFNNHTKKWASVNGKNGYVIAPDGFTGELASSYADDAELASAGNLVFLPAAGGRYGSVFDDVGVYGNYWSSTAYDDDGSDAYSVLFECGEVYHSNYCRHCGYSVRLITDVK